MAKYSYLSDEMKTGALKADGSGFVYRGSLKYSRSAGGVLSLVGAEIPSGMLTPGGPCFEVKDHLGSVVYEIAAASGDYADGALYGEWGSHEALSVGASSATSRRHYTGKEDQWPDFAVPYTDFGARHYSPALRGWLTPDPLSEKYYTSSPYAYCAGNPINVVDPDGRTIKIWSQDSESYIEYHPEKKYDGSDSFIRIVYDLLNNAYFNGADKVFNQLIAAREDYRIINDIGRIGTLQFVSRDNEMGGSMLAGPLLSDSYDLTLGVEAVSHELFHALQYKEGQGGASIVNEVEAYVFGFIVGESYQNTLSSIFQKSKSNSGNGSVIGSAFQSYFNAIAKDKKNIPVFFEMAVGSFKKGAYVNMTGLYNRFPIILPNYKANLLLKYYPK